MEVGFAFTAHYGVMIFPDCILAFTAFDGLCPLRDFWFLLDLGGSLRTVSAGAAVPDYYLFVSVPLYSRMGLVADSLTLRLRAFEWV